MGLVRLYLKLLSGLLRLSSRRLPLRLDRRDDQRRHFVVSRSVRMYPVHGQPRLIVLIVSLHQCGMVVNHGDGVGGPVFLDERIELSDAIIAARRAICALSKL